MGEPKSLAERVAVLEALRPIDKQDVEDLEKTMHALRGALARVEKLLTDRIVLLERARYGSRMFFAGVAATGGFIGGIITTIVVKAIEYFSSSPPPPSVH